LNGYSFGLSEDTVFKEATIHQKFDFLEKYSLSGLPRFDDLASYNVTKENHDRLLKLEIKRVVDTATSKDAYTVDSKTEFKHTNAAFFEELSLLAQRISTDSSVTSLDNCTMIMSNRPKAELVEAVLMTMKEPYALLRGVHITDEKYGTEKPITGCSARSRELSFALIDYLTGCIAHLLVRTVVSTQWNNQHVALLAQLAVKLKVLSSDSKRYALQAIKCAEDTIESYEDSNEPRATVVLQTHVEGKGIEEKHLQVHEDIDLARLYFTGNLLNRRFIHDIFQPTIVGLHHSLISRRGFEDFHHHTVAYDTGFDPRSLVVVSEDRNGFVSTTSATAYSQICCRALTLLKANVESVKQAQTPPSSSVSTDGESCIITLEWTERQSTTTQLPASTGTKFSTFKLDDIISIMVPLLLTTPLVASKIEEFVQFALGPASSQTNEMVRCFENYSFEASCSVQTSTNAVSQEKTFDQTPDTLPISRSGLIGKFKGNESTRTCPSITLTCKQPARSSTATGAALFMASQQMRKSALILASLSLQRS
jgi:hypothetical protein